MPKVYVYNDMIIETVAMEIDNDPSTKLEVSMEYYEKVQRISKEWNDLQDELQLMLEEQGE